MIGRGSRLMARSLPCPSRLAELVFWVLRVTKLGDAVYGDCWEGQCPQAFCASQRLLTQCHPRDLRAIYLSTIQHFQGAFSAE